MRLVDADAVNAGRRVAAGQFFLAVEADEARLAAAVGAPVVGDQTRAAVVAHQRIARVELLLAELALETYQSKHIIGLLRGQFFYPLKTTTCSPTKPKFRA